MKVYAIIDETGGSFAQMAGYLSGSIGDPDAFVSLWTTSALALDEILRLESESSNTDPAYSIRTIELDKPYNCLDKPV